jgi:hypothetical protein
LTHHIPLRARQGSCLSVPLVVPFFFFEEKKTTTPFARRQIIFCSPDSLTAVCLLHYLRLHAHARCCSLLNLCLAASCSAAPSLKRAATPTSPISYYYSFAPRASSRASPRHLERFSFLIHASQADTAICLVVVHTFELDQSPKRAAEAE